MRMSPFASPAPFTAATRVPIPLGGRHRRRAGGMRFPLPYGVGIGHTKAPRPRVHTDSVVAPRSMCMSQIMRAPTAAESAESILHDRARAACDQRDDHAAFRAFQLDADQFSSDED
jgi:hypothetical protein